MRLTRKELQKKSRRPRAFEDSRTHGRVQTRKVSSERLRKGFRKGQIQGTRRPNPSASFPPKSSCQETLLPTLCVGQLSTPSENPLPPPKKTIVLHKKIHSIQPQPPVPVHSFPLPKSPTLNVLSLSVLTETIKDGHMSRGFWSKVKGVRTDLVVGVLVVS